MGDVVTKYILSVIKQYDEDYQLFKKQSILLIPEKEEMFTTSSAKNLWYSLPDIIDFHSKKLLMAKYEYETILNDNIFLEELLILIDNHEGIIFLNTVNKDENFILLWKMLIEAKRELNNFNNLKMDAKHYNEEKRGINRLSNELKDIQKKLKHPLFSIFAFNTEYIFPQSPKEIIENILESLDELGIDFEKSSSILPILNDILVFKVKRLPKKYQAHLELSKHMRSTTMHRRISKYLSQIII